MKRIIIVLLLLFAGACSRNHYVPVETVRTEYRDRDVLRRDSIFIRDSSMIIVRHDTVFVTKYRYVGDTKSRIDSIYINRTDTLRVPYPVERPLTRWESVKQRAGGYALWGMAICVLLAIVVLIRWLRVVKF